MEGRNGRRVCLVEVGARYVLACAEFREGVSWAVGRRAGRTPFSGRHALRSGDEGGAARSRTAGPGLRGAVLSESVRHRHGRTGGRGQRRPGWAQVLESSHKQLLAVPGAPFRGSGYLARAGPEHGSPGLGTCWASRSGSPPPSRASPWRNSCMSTRPSLLLSSSSKRRPQRCRRSASAGPPRMAPARGGGRGAWQRRPQRGLRGSPSPPGPRRASSAATATAASAVPALALALAAGGDCEPSPPAPELASPPPTLGEGGWGLGAGLKVSGRLSGMLGCDTA